MKTNAQQDRANLDVFREQAVEDGSLSSIGMVTTLDGFDVLAGEGTHWEFYASGATQMTFKQVGSNLQFTVDVETLPFPERHW